MVMAANQHALFILACHFNAGLGEADAGECEKINEWDSERYFFEVGVVCDGARFYCLVENGTCCSLQQTVCRTGACHLQVLL